jgi:serine/threonine-protein kinase
MDVKQAVDVLLPVASAVAAGHDHGVVHRDLKPQNIFLAYGPWGEPVPKVLDFGVSKLVGEGDSANLTGTMAFLGTAAYMSPEQARGARRVDGQSDQYALGLIFYEMLTGARAHPGEHPLEVLHNVTSGAIVPPGQLRPDLPEPLVAALMRMLAGTPTDRHPSLRAVGRALMPFASERVRLAMADAFRETALDSALPSSSSSSSSSPLAGGTQMLPQPNTQPSTRPDRPSRKVDTTLGQTASEVAPPVAGRPPRRGIAIGVVSAVAAVAIGAFVLVGRKSPAPEHAPAAATAPPAVAPAAVDDAPAKVAEPSADKPKKASHGTKTSHATPRPAASPAAAAAKPDCDPNFYLDAQGEKHFKPECFLKR